MVYGAGKMGGMHALDQLASHRSLIAGNIAYSTMIEL